MSSASELFAEHLWLPPERCRILGVRGPALDDAAQEGRLALWRAANRFDPDRGVPFDRYARVWVDGAIKETLCRVVGPVGTPVKIASKRAARGLRALAVAVSFAESTSDDECRPTRNSAARVTHEMATLMLDDEELAMAQRLDLRRRASWLRRMVARLPREQRGAVRAKLRGIGTIAFADRHGMHRDTARLRANEGIRRLRDAAQKIEETLR